MVCARVQCCPCVRPCSSVDEISILMSSGESFRFRRGEVLWDRGESADSLVVVCTGTLKLTQPWEEGREVILELVNRGEIVGEEAAIPHSARLTSCTALSAGRGVRLSREVLSPVVRQDPELGMLLLKASYRHAKAKITRLDEMTVGSVRSRVARVLLRLGSEHGLDDARGRFVPVPLKRGDLADMVACRVETVIRVMTEWQRRDVMETQREGFVIRTPGELEAAVAEG